MKKVSVVILTRNRKTELKECVNSVRTQNYSQLEIVIIDNGSTDGTSELFQENLKDERVNYLRQEENKGVAKGRNVGIARSNGDILVFLDDDAVFEKKNAITKIVRRFSDSDPVGVIGFKSLNYETREVVWQEIPLKDKTLDHDREQETSYYLGGACAIKKEVFDRVGKYSDRFVYAFEELDLSFKIVDTGYKIIYLPGVAILHKNPAEGNVKDPNYWEKMLENRIRASIRNLPWRYVFSSSLIWSAYTLLKTAGRLDVLFKAYRNLYVDGNILLKERKPISSETLSEIKNLQGRALY